MIDHEATVLRFGQGPVIDVKYKSVLEPISYHSQESPEVIALQQGTRQMTYGELDRLSTNLSYYLIAQGIENGDFVPLITSRSFEMIIGLLGIMKAGAAYIPIDNQMPVERIRAIVEESKARYALVHHDTPKETADEIIKIAKVILLNKHTLHAIHSPCEPNRKVQGSDPAYVVFTSGSTGKPKGVVISHLSLSNYVTVQIPNRYTPGNRKIGNVASVNFDMTVSDIFLALSHGSELHLKHGDSYDFLKNVDYVVITISLLRLLKPSDFPNLKMIKRGGEPIDDKVAKSWLK